MRSPAFLAGKVTWKTIKGRRYGHWAFKEIDGRKREYYLGPEGPGITALETAHASGSPALQRTSAASVTPSTARTSPRRWP